MERFLQQLEAQIAGFRPADRSAMVEALQRIFNLLATYGRPKISGGAVMRLVSMMMIAQASDGMEAFKQKLRDKAKTTGPYVGALFQAL